MINRHLTNNVAFLIASHEELELVLKNLEKFTYWTCKLYGFNVKNWFIGIAVGDQEIT